MFVEVDEPVLKFTWRWEGPPETVLRKNDVGGLLLLDFETYYNLQ